MVIVLGLTAYACFTKKDFTNMIGYLLVLMMVGIFFLVFGWFVDYPLYHIIIAAFMVFLFGCFLVYDTQMIVGGRNYELSYDDYVLGAMVLYIDIIMIFYYILKILNRS